MGDPAVGAPCRVWGVQLGGRMLLHRSHALVGGHCCGAPQPSSAIRTPHVALGRTITQRSRAPLWSSGVTSGPQVVATNARKLLTVVFSFVLFPKPFSAMYALSGVAVVAGVGMHSYSRRVAKAQAAKALQKVE